MSSIQLLCRDYCKAAVEAPAGQSETLLRQTPLGLLGTSLTSGLSGGPTAAGQLQGPQLEM